MLSRNWGRVSTNIVTLNIVSAIISTQFFAHFYEYHFDMKFYKKNIIWNFSYGIYLKIRNYKICTLAFITLDENVIKTPSTLPNMPSIVKFLLFILEYNFRSIGSRRDHSSFPSRKQTAASYWFVTYLARMKVEGSSILSTISSRAILVLQYILRFILSRRNFFLNLIQQAVINSGAINLTEWVGVIRKSAERRWVIIFWRGERLGDKLALKECGRCRLDLRGVRVGWKYVHGWVENDRFGGKGVRFRAVRCPGWMTGKKKADV